MSIERKVGLLKSITQIMHDSAQGLMRMHTGGDWKNLC